MKTKILTALITLVQYLIIVAIALIVFTYIIVPLAHNSIHEKTIYVPIPCEDAIQSTPNEIIDPKDVRLL